MEDLQKFGVPAADILGMRQTDAFRAADAVPGRARPRALRERLSAPCPRPTASAQRPGLIMAAIYRALLEEIERDGFRVLTQRTSLTPLRKFWIAWKTWVSRVAVVGAGYAGMAAAVTLAERGVPVTVFESGPVPGGRARRVVSQGTELDNGQHILVGAYTRAVPADAYWSACRRAPSLRVPLELRYARRVPAAQARLPDPACSRKDSAARDASDARAFHAFISLRKRSPSGCRKTFQCANLLEQHGQNGASGHYVWRPLCVSALNTPLELASAQVFAAVLRDSIAGAGGARSDFLLPQRRPVAPVPGARRRVRRAHGGEAALQTHRSATCGALQDGIRRGDRRGRRRTSSRRCVAGARARIRLPADLHLLPAVRGERRAGLPDARLLGRPGAVGVRPRQR